MWHDEAEGIEINESEIGEENYQRYLRMSPESQGKARKRYQHVLKSLQSTDGTDDPNFHSEDAEVTNFLFEGEDEPNQESWASILKLVAVLVSLLYCAYMLMPTNREEVDFYDMVKASE